MVISLSRIALIDGKLLHECGLNYTIDYLTNFLLWFSLYVFVVIALCGMYGQIVRETRRHGSSVGDNSQSTTISGTTARNYKVHKCFMIVILAYGVCSLPYIILSSVIAFYGLENREIIIHFDWISMEFLLLNSAVNVIIYAVYSAEFRKAYKSVLCFRNQQVGNE